MKKKLSTPANHLNILGCKANFTWKHLFTKPFKFIIKWWMQLMNRPPYHHIADNYDAFGKSHLINHVIGSGGESVDYLDCLKKRNSKVYSYAFKAPIDFDLWNKNTIKSDDFLYDAKGAIFSETHQFWVGSFFKRNHNDKRQYCNENTIWKLQNQGYLKNVKNRNEISTGELIQMLIKQGLVSKTPILVWNGKEMVNNIFE